jgi:hypothetical protein
MRLRAVSLALVPGLALGLSACTDGTTPDCSDAQCAVVVVYSESGVSGAGADGGADASADAVADEDGGVDASSDAASNPDAGSDAAP